MGRKVAIVGAVLAVLGASLEMWAFRYLLYTEPVDQTARVIDYLVGLLPVLGAVCATAGVVMIGLGLVHLLTGHPAVPDNRSVTLWAGIGLVVLMTTLEIVTMSGPVVGAMPGSAREGFIVVMIQGVHLVRLVGAVLIALWLTWFIMSPRPLTSARSKPPLEPSRPF